MIDKISALHVGVKNYSNDLYIVLGIICGFELDIKNIKKRELYLTQQLADFLKGIEIGVKFKQYADEVEIKKQMHPALTPKAIKITMAQNLKMYKSKQTLALFKKIVKLKEIDTLEYIDVSFKDCINVVKNISLTTCCPLVAGNLIVVSQKDYDDYLENFIKLI